jgi:predicted Zn finger-like uncharacterized protein
MHLVCPVCTTAYMIPDSRIPKKISLATCRECGAKISIEPEAVGNLPMPSPLWAPAALMARSRSWQRSERSPTRAWITAELGLRADYPELNDLDPGIFRLSEIFAPTNRVAYKKTRIGEFKAKVVTATKGVLARMSRMTGR